MTTTECEAHGDHVHFVIRSTAKELDAFRFDIDQDTIDNFETFIIFAMVFSLASRSEIVESVEDDLVQAVTTMPDDLDPGQEVGVAWTADETGLDMKAGVFA